MRQLTPEAAARLAAAPLSGVIYTPDERILTLPPCRDREQVRLNALACPRPDGSECCIVDNVEGTILAIMRWHNGSTTIEEVR